MALSSTIQPYNPMWPEIFADEADLLKPVFGDALIAIHHVGSTAIPGVAAKPEIDILVELNANANLTDFIANLAEVNFVGGTSPYPSGHLYFRKNQNGKRTHKMHLCNQGHICIEEQLLFRDYLRSNKNRSEQYVQLKLDLEKKNKTGMLEYLAGKEPFIWETLQLARLKNGPFL